MLSNLPAPVATVDHVFVDFENIPAIDLAIVGAPSVSFTLLVGPRQTKLDVALVEKMLQHAGSVFLVRLASAGKNALDFALVYYLGRAIAADPAGRFHIVSRDNGFTPLIEHLRTQGLQVRRHDGFATLNLAPTAATSKSQPQPQSQSSVPSVNSAAPLDSTPAAVALDLIRKAATVRPKTRKKLANYLRAHLGKKFGDTDAETLIEHLQQTGQLTVSDKGGVTYRLDQT